MGVSVRSGAECGQMSRTIMTLWTRITDNTKYLCAQSYNSCLYGKRRRGISVLKTNDLRHFLLSNISQMALVGICFVTFNDSVIMSSTSLAVSTDRYVVAVNTEFLSPKNYFLNRYLFLQSPLLNSITSASYFEV